MHSRANLHVHDNPCGRPTIPIAPTRKGNGQAQDRMQRPSTCRAGRGFVRQQPSRIAVGELPAQSEGTSLVEMGFGPSNTATTLQGTRSRVSDSGSRSRRSRPWVNERAFLSAMRARAGRARAFPSYSREPGHGRGIASGRRVPGSTAWNASSVRARSSEIFARNSATPRAVVVVPESCGVRIDDVMPVTVRAGLGTQPTVRHGVIAPRESTGCCGVPGRILVPASVRAFPRIPRHRPAGPCADPSRGRAGAGCQCRRRCRWTAPIDRGRTHRPINHRPVGPASAGQL